TDTSSVLTRTTSGGFTDFICKNGKPHTDNGIFYPLYKLAVFTVGNLSFIHIKRTDSNRFRRSILYVRKVIIRLTHYKGTPRNKGHTVRFLRMPFSTLHTYQLTFIVRPTTAHQKSDSGCKCNEFLHII